MDGKRRQGYVTGVQDGPVAVSGARPRMGATPGRADALPARSPDPVPGRRPLGRPLPAVKGFLEKHECLPGIRTGGIRE